MISHRRWLALAGWLVILVAVSFFFNYLGLVVAVIMAGYYARHWDDWAPALGRRFVNFWSTASALVIPKLKWHQHDWELVEKQNILGPLANYGHGVTTGHHYLHVYRCAGCGRTKTVAGL